MSLQRRRERYYIIYMWKIKNKYAPNDIDISWKNHIRLGSLANIPKVATNRKILSAYESSFVVFGPKLWNALPKSINIEPCFSKFKTELDQFLQSFPDEPPTRGYTPRNTNSILNWCSCRYRY